MSPKGEVMAQLIESIAEVQRGAGRPVPPIDENTVPYDDIEGYDSLNGLESSVAFSEKHPSIKRLPFRFAGSGKHMSIGQITDAVIQKLAGASKASSKAFAL